MLKAKASSINCNAIPKTILDFEGYDFRLSIEQTTNPKTERPIVWTYDLGLEKNWDGTYRVHTKPRASLVKVMRQNG